MVVAQETAAHTFIDGVDTHQDSPIFVVEVHPKPLSLVIMQPNQSPRELTLKGEEKVVAATAAGSAQENLFAVLDYLGLGFTEITLLMNIKPRQYNFNRALAVAEKSPNTHLNELAAWVGDRISNLAILNGNNHERLPHLPQKANIFVPNIPTNGHQKMASNHATSIYDDFASGSLIFDFIDDEDDE
jgi:hypothetical protein